MPFSVSFYSLRLAEVHCHHPCSFLTLSYPFGNKFSPIRALPALLILLICMSSLICELTLIIRQTWKPVNAGCRARQTFVILIHGTTLGLSSF